MIPGPHISPPDAAVFAPLSVLDLMQWFLFSCFLKFAQSNFFASAGMDRESRRGVVAQSAVFSI